MDAGRGVRPGRDPGGELRARRPGLRAPRGRARARGRARQERADAGAVPLLELSPVLTGLRVYPFVRLTEARRRLEAAGADAIDFGIGEPREETPAFIRRALADAIEPLSSYPLAEGLPELREAAAGWVARRFGVALDPATEVVPTLGAKEAIFSLAQVVGPGKVAVTTPGYPVAERGALFAHREVVELPLRAPGFLPDLDAVPWAELALLWLNYPNNPTAATAPPAFYARAAALAREHGVVLASDEAYCELWFEGEAPASALQVAGRANVLAFHTLSKRSSMPGYRAGFVAGDAHLVGALKRFRPNAGVAPQTFVQRAAAAAWNDDEHVEAVRCVYRAKRDALLPALLEAGLRPAGGHASFFLWLAIPAGWSGSEAFALALLEEGLIVTPGAFFGPAGEGYVRIALVPALARCEEAARRLSRWRAAPR
jgi:acetylornithine aminotransferase